MRSKSVMCFSLRVCRRLQHQRPTSHEVGMPKLFRPLCCCRLQHRLQHQRPASHEVGMPKLFRPLCCRLQHQRPTSHEVGMRKVRTQNLGFAHVGYNIMNPLLTRWVCAKT
jgi:hypothetical protein